MMYFTFGNYRHASGEVNLSSITVLPERIESGPVIRLKETWVLEGELFAASGVALTLALQELQRVYQLQDGGIAALHHDDGTLTAHILGLNSLGGCRLVSFSYPQGGKEEYVVSRKYQIVLEASRIAAGNLSVIAFEEHLEFDGGGIEYVWRKPLEGEPIRQPVGADTYRATQSGSATGLLFYPSAPAPLWPQWVKGNPRPALSSPRRNGPVGSPYYTDWTVSWNYQFEAAIPLEGLPNIYPG